MKMTEFKRKKIRITLDKGAVVELMATKVTENLYVHKEIDKDTLKPSRRTKNVRWVITEILTGMTVWHMCFDREQAVRLAYSLNERFNIDNSFEFKKLQDDKQKRDECYQFIMEFMIREDEEDVIPSKDYYRSRLPK